MHAMTTEITMRDETPADVSAITEVTLQAFKSLQISQHNEQLVVAALRQAGKLTVSLVAQFNAEVIGHIAFSPVTLSDGTPDWYGLGPVSVLPRYQRQGIGSALIRAGLARLKSLNGAGCCLVGHPQYYPRFGFANTTDLVLHGVPAEVFLPCRLIGPARAPRSTFTRRSPLAFEACLKGWRIYATRRIGIVAAFAQNWGIWIRKDAHSCVNHLPSGAAWGFC